MPATSDVRTSLYGSEDLNGLLAPRSIAVVGASAKPGSFGGQIILNLKDDRDLELFAVNPRADDVHGVRSYGSLAEIERLVDLVAICVPRDGVVAVAREASECGIRNAIVYSSGFEESGTAEGRRAQQELVALAEQGLRILGPNCLGYINAHRQIEMQFITAYASELVLGGISVIAQSGALGFVLTQSMFEGVGFSYWASVGNSVDVDAFDLANFMIEDPNTRVVVLVLEGTENGQRLLELGRRSRASGKPVIVHKLGRSEIGAASARSHTGALAGSDAVFQEVFDRAGFVSVDHFDQLIEVASLFAKCGRAGASGLGVFSASGGAAIMAADESERVGVDLPALSDDIEGNLLKILPGFGSVGNPADVTAEAVKDSQMFTAALGTFAGEEAYGMVLVTLTVAQESMTGIRSRVITEFAGSRPEGATPIATLWLSPWTTGPGYRTLMADPNVPVFRSLQTAMTAFRKWIEWSDNTEVLPPATAYEPDDAAMAAARIVSECASQACEFADAASGTLLLDESESKQVIDRLGVTTSSPLVVGVEDLDQGLEALEFPVVAKIVSRRIAHKARVGGVRLNLNTPVEVREAVKDFAERFSDDGIRVKTLVERMVTGEREWFVGARRDPAFGVVLTLGLGGVDVEGRSPVMIVGSPSAEAISDRLKARTKDSHDPLPASSEVRRALASVAERVYLLFAAQPELSEIDINPLLETPDGLIAVDAAIIVDVASGERAAG